MNDIRLTSDGGIRHLVLAARNGLNAAMLAEIAGAVATVAADLPSNPKEPKEKDD